MSKKAVAKEALTLNTLPRAPNLFKKTCIHTLCCFVYLFVQDLKLRLTFYFDRTCYYSLHCNRLPNSSILF